jgi:hypothetical protein
MNANTNMNIAITRELLARGDHNVIVVDWSRGEEYNSKNIFVKKLNLP